MDLRVQQELRLGRRRLVAGADFLDRFDRDRVATYTRPYRDGFNLDDPVFFAGFDPEAVIAATPGLLPDARYQQASGSGPPRDPAAGPVHVLTR